MSNSRRRFSGLSREQDRVFGEALSHMDETIRMFLATTTAPRERSLGRVQVYRFKEQDESHALLLKLIRIPSNLRAAKLLIEYGFLYEWNIVRRSLWENFEDILFLLAAHRVKGSHAVQERFLKSFYTEILSPDGGISDERVNAVPRYRIRKLLYEEFAEKLSGEGEDGERLADLARAIYGAGSSHVHGRAAAILQLYDPSSEQFETNGTRRDAEVSLAIASLWTLTYCCIHGFGVVGGNWVGSDYQTQIVQFAEHFLATTPSFVGSHRTGN